VEVIVKIGIGLPAAIPNVSGSLIREWARHADEGPFSSLGVIDRLVYGNFEPLITLAVVAGETQRVRLLTGVLLAPLRRTGILAKQAASLDALSNGRLTLGLGIGAREDDYRAAPAPFHSRGKYLEQKLEHMTSIWSGQPANNGTGPMGPAPVQPGGPEILIGGYSPAAINRVKRWGNGYIASGGDPQRISGLFRQAEDNWQSAGRPGKPRLVAMAYYGLGPDAASRAAAYLLDYYAFRGPAAQQVTHSVLSSPEAVKTSIQAFADIGTDELVLLPCIPELNQVDLLADIVTI
jgi:alkanesulfonate monooxygenase SsuD/methylene tetrahydromethanopterin reductase-like flavin-dependent oxidoreductase (luciferase family)